MSQNRKSHMSFELVRTVPTATFQMLVVALVHSRLVYGNTVLVGIPAYLVSGLQSRYLGPLVAVAVLKPNSTGTSSS